jgi:mRNA interferase MazF
MTTTRHTMSFDSGEVVLVAFPFTDPSTTKQRPAAIVSSRRYNDKRPDVILLAITSQVRYPLHFGEAIIKDWQQSGLIKASLFKPLLATIEQTLVRRRLGRLTIPDLNTLRGVLGAILR